MNALLNAMLFLIFKKPISPLEDADFFAVNSRIKNFKDF